VERLLADGERLGKHTGAVSVSHGDLHVRHLLVDENARAAGVIDWGDLCVADPSVDLSLAYGGFAGKARTALLSAYGPVTKEQETRARVLAVFLCAALAEYAADTARDGLLAEALAGIERAVAD
jgi:aminoglycoside phosphotransferase (APT) family kinase protein